MRKDLEDVNEALKDAQRYLRYRLRSKKEIEDYLKRRGYKMDVVRDVIGKLEKSGIIDDERFARMYALDGIRLKFKGPRILKSELKRLGVDEGVAGEAITEIVEELDFEDLVARHASKLKRFDDQALKRYLFSRGFERDQITKIEKCLRTGGE